MRWVVLGEGSAPTGSRATWAASTPSNRRIPEPNSTGESVCRELVDQARVDVLQDRCASARDADIPVVVAAVGLLERGLDAVVDEVERRATRPRPRVTLLVRHDEHRRVERRAAPATVVRPASNMRLPITLAPVRSRNVSRR